MTRLPWLRALPPYLGNKRRLLPIIFALLADVHPPTAWPASRFLDPFAGSCAVALFAKAQAFEVVASDIAEHSAMTARALIANSATRLTRAHLAALYRPAAADMTLPQIFHPLQAPLLSTMLGNLPTFQEPLRSLLGLTLMKLLLGSVPMSLLTATDAPYAARSDYDRISSRRLGHYLGARSGFTPAAAWKAASDVNAGVIGGHGSACRLDALTALERFEADVLYLDPPYAGTTGYAQTYALLNSLLGASPDDAAVPALDDLFDAAARVPYVVLSYGGPSLSLESLTALVRRHRPVLKALAVPHSHLRSVAKEESYVRNREYIVVAGR